MDVLDCESIAEARDMILVAERDEARVIVCAEDPEKAFYAVASLKKTALLLLLSEEHLDRFSPPRDLAADAMRWPASDAEIRVRLKFLLRLFELTLSDSAAHAVPHSAEHSRAMLDRKGLLTFLDNEWRRCLRYEWPLSALLIQLNDLDAVAKALSIQPGALHDRLGLTLTEAVHRPGDRLGTWSTGIFCSILSETDSKGGAYVAERIHRVFDGVDRGPKLAGSLSIGVASLSPVEFYRSLRFTAKLGAGPGPEALIKMAENSLEHAVEARKGTWVSS